MKLAEIFERHQICDDEKARRVLNVSQDRANITADEIENGVTIERLTALNVPVFRYSTQVTIHGNLPDFNPESRPMGYKAIFRNQNGSLGVKYVAIDAAKKSLVAQAFDLCGACESQFSACVNSQGLELVFVSRDRESAIEAFRAFPKDLIIGGLYAARGLYGEFYVVANVGAIEAGNLWPLIGKLYGYNSQAELDAAQAARNIQYAKDRAESDAKWQQQAIERESQKAARVQLAMSQITLPKMDKLPPGECSFVRLNDDGELFLYAVVKKAFGQLYYTTRKYATGMTFADLDLSKKMKRWSERKPIIERSLSAGRVFKLS